MTGGELVAVIAVCGTVLTGLVTAIFHGSSMSRCKTIDCFCFKCEREVLQNEELYNQNRVVTPQE